MEVGLARRKTSSVFRTGLLAGLGAVYYFFVRPQMLKAGTRLGESQRRLRGDDLIVEPNYQVTRAIEIDAPPEAVWPWIAQMGRDRNGFYGLDRVSNRGIPSLAYLRQDLPALEPGMLMDEGHRVLDMEPNRFMLYGGFDLPTPIGSPAERTTLMQLERRQDGGTRLLVRTRGYTYGTLGPFYNLVYEVIDYVNTTVQLENIRQRAETMGHLHATTSS
jgi:hypothetical protein